MSVTVASSGEEALGKLAHVRCDVALLDLHLPGISGLDLLARLKELQPEMEVTISLHEGVPVAIELPPRATLEVVETEPTIKSQTAASSYKPAMLSNGVRTMVPPFVTTGTKIVVMTADGSYVERAKG